MTCAKEIIVRHIQREINGIRTIRYGEKMGPEEFKQKSRIVAEGSALRLLVILEMEGYEIVVKR